MEFDILAIWNEYVSSNIESNLNYECLKFIDEGNYKEASKVTTSCVGKSRGFHGETEEWMQEWIQGKHPSVPEYVFKSAVVYEETDNQIVGISCVGIYGEENKILWIREIAVKPEFQGMGIGRKLIEKAFTYGLKHGAKKSFLMADEINYNALHLYKAMGFKANPNECQIDMIR
ncbi:MAG: GNAT family N-acetyltransferase [Clostridium sp.]|uniref:GNAT family N-acetyltransferase n=1 Tax=Clostridium sp. TaxID=1506 RepID=UPI0025B7F93C|nr:GNAT family N-acetyltransferase [Clostridium sp.]MCF0149001.1 GNAT family N-acetyltransferase [Clostridium sp.]